MTTAAPFNPDAGGEIANAGGDDFLHSGKTTILCAENEAGAQRSVQVEGQPDVLVTFQDAERVLIPIPSDYADQSGSVNLTYPSGAANLRLWVLEA